MSMEMPSNRSEISSPKQLIGRDVRTVTSDELAAARDIVGAANLCTCLDDGQPPLENGLQLVLYINPSSKIITRYELRNGRLYQSVQDNPNFEELGSRGSMQFRQRM